MKYKNWIIVLILIGLAFGIGVYIFIYNSGYKKENGNDKYEATRTEATTNSTGNQKVNQNEIIANNEKATNEKQEEVPQKAEENVQGNSQENTQEQKQPEPVETEISSYSTKIVTKDASRQNNIRITCNSLNGTTVEPGATFSFCGTVGQATTAKGYQKADIFDANGNKKKGLGGGNCQISSTLYNAVLTVPSLKVTERHPHSNKVPYVQSGKDAAVAYGSYDFKFVNNTGYKIKILASTDGDQVTTKIVSIK